jgi:hypothetical protein
LGGTRKQKPFMHIKIASLVEISSMAGIHAQSDPAADCEKTSDDVGLTLRFLYL